MTITNGGVFWTIGLIVLILIAVLIITPWLDRIERGD